jgi:hypothetical protein
LRNTPQPGPAKLDSKAAALLKDELTEPVVRDFLMPLCTGGIVSRHVSHPDNVRAKDYIAKELRAILGEGAVHCPYLQYIPSRQNVIGRLRGTDLGDEIVMVGAHFDSTASNEPDYCWKDDAAPGADDNASGVAGVLAAAKVLTLLKGESRPRRSIEFAFFNDEEGGFHGSSDAVKSLQATSEKFVTLLNMDMIGYCGDACGDIEIHTAAPQDLKFTSHIGMKNSDPRGRWPRRFVCRSIRPPAAATRQRPGAITSPSSAVGFQPSSFAKTTS